MEKDAIKTTLVIENLLTFVNALLSLCIYIKYSGDIGRCQPQVAN